MAGRTWMLVRSLAARRREPMTRDAGALLVDATDPAGLAEGALRGMGLTRDFAPEVILLGHASRSRANTHFSTLDCGACAAHGGGTNAKVLADLLNKMDIRETLALRGIDIPAGTRFFAGEHNTTTEEISLYANATSELRQSSRRLPTPSRSSAPADTRPAERDASCVAAPLTVRRLDRSGTRRQRRIPRRSSTFVSGGRPIWTVLLALL